MHKTLLSLAIVLVGYSQGGAGIKCWECNSKYDPNCADPFKPHTLAMADCTQRFLAQDEAVEATICRKLTQKVGTEVRVIRSCGYLAPEEAGTCNYRAGTHMVFMDYCQCAGDGCNRAGHMQEPPSHLLLSSAALFLALLCIFS